MTRLPHVAEQDIQVGVSLAVAKIAATILVDFEGDRATDLAVSLACDLFEKSTKELTRRLNLEIDRTNARIAETLGSVAPGGDA